MIPNAFRRAVAPLFLTVLAVAAAQPASASFQAIQLDGTNVKILLSRRFDDGTLVVAARWSGDMGQPLTGQSSATGAFFIASYDADGVPLGQPTIIRPSQGNSVTIRSLEIETDGLNKMVYVGGEFKGDISFGSTLLTTTDDFTCPGYEFDQEVYAAKLDLTGSSWQWARRFGSVRCPGVAGNQLGPFPSFPDGADDLLGGLALGTGADQFVYLAVTSRSALHTGSLVDPDYSGSFYPDFGSRGSGVVLARTPKAPETALSYPAQYRPGTVEPPQPDDIYAIRAFWHTNAQMGCIGCGQNTGAGQHRDWTFEANALVFDNGQLWLLASWYDPDFLLAQYQQQNGSSEGQQVTLFRIIVPASAAAVDITEVNPGPSWGGTGGPANYYGYYTEPPTGPPETAWTGDFATYAQRIPELGYGLEMELDRTGKLVISAIAACDGREDSAPPLAVTIPASDCPAGDQTTPLDRNSIPKAYVLVAQDTGITPLRMAPQVQFLWAYETTDNWWDRRITAIEADGNGAIYVAEMDCVGRTEPVPFLAPFDPNLTTCGTTPRTGRVRRIKRDGTTSVGSEVWSAGKALAGGNELSFLPFSTYRRQGDPSVGFRQTPLSIDGRNNPLGSQQIFFGGNLATDGTVILDTETITAPDGKQVGFLAAVDQAGNWLRRYQVDVGTVVPQPLGTTSAEPSFVVAGGDVASKYFYWDAGTSQLWAVHPGVAKVQWTSSTAGDPPVVQTVTLKLPTTPQHHAAGAPAYLASSDSGFTFAAMHWSDGELSTVTGGVFNRTAPGWSVLRFSKVSPASVAFEVVRSVDPRDVETLGFTTLDDCTVGTVLSLASPAHSDSAGYTGWPIDALAIYDATAPYDRATRTGRLVAVNKGTLDVVWSTRSAQTGVAWPDTSRRHTCVWPTSPPEIMVDNEIGSGPLSVGNPEIYRQDNRALPGFNPNDEHALVAPATPGSTENAVFALRSEGTVESEAYVILKSRTNAADAWSYTVYKVPSAASAPYARNGVVVGDYLSPPYPLPVVGDCDSTFGTGTPYWEDVRSKPFARSNGQAKVFIYYPLLEGFWWDPAGSHSNVGTPGQCIPYRRDVLDVDSDGNRDEVLHFTYKISWPTNTPVLRIGDHLFDAKDGLPDLRHQAAAEVIFEGTSVPEGTSVLPSVPLSATRLVRLTDPMAARSVPVPVGFQLSWFALAPHEIRVRLGHDTVANRLSFKGFYDGTLLGGEPLLLPNVMLDWERLELRGQPGCVAGLGCQAAIDALYELTNDPNQVPDVGAGYANPISGSTVWVGLEPFGAGLRAAHLLGGAPMLTAGGARAEGWVALALNNSASLDPQGLPTKVVPIKVACSGGSPSSDYVGSLQQMPSDNVLEQRLVLRHSSDHGFEPNRNTFFWYRAPSSESPVAPTYGQTGIPGSPWTAGPSGPGAIRYSIEGQSLQTIIDNDVIMKWSSPLTVCTTLHRWAGDATSSATATHAKLTEGWIKRVVRNLNPFRARVLGFHLEPTATYVSMIGQAGKPYRGPVTFNGSPANLDSLGLIEAYETVLREARALTIDSPDPLSQSSSAGHDALLLVSTRIAELYSLLANEAVSDAADPTIAFSTQSSTYGTLASSIFAFQNQVPSLLEEELGLLRGRDGTAGSVGLFPVYNRMLWNFTSGEGEVAYSQVYNLEDETGDALITEADAQVAFPQGHGDAWGHFLTAQKRWYGLLRDESFDWHPRAERINVGGTAVTVDYRDERKFATVAAAKAKVGAEVLNLTYRQQYVEDPAGQFQGYGDPDRERAWGVDDWARRSAQGAYFDWAVANALLPHVWAQGDRACSPELGTDDDECPDEPIDPQVGEIDRTNVPELLEIAEGFTDVQRRIDEADLGLNPLGLAKGVVPFDIDPSLIDPPTGGHQTHFEQIYQRAVGALENAVSVFDYAASLTQNLRRNQDKLSDFQNNVADEERDQRNRLIEIFGYPYADDIGPNRTYEAGYDGPDIYHYMYVDQAEVTGRRPEARETIHAFFTPIRVTGTFTIDPATPPEPPGAILEVLYDFEPGGAGLSKPTSWTGARRAPGTLQEILSDLKQAQIKYEQALHEYDNLITEIGETRDDLKRQKNFELDSLKIIDENNGKQESFNAYIVRRSSEVRRMQIGADAVSGLAEAVSESLPKVVGVTEADPSGPIRGAVLAGGVAVSTLIRLGAELGEEQVQEKEYAKEMADLLASRKLEAEAFDEELENMKGDLETMLRQEIIARLEVLKQMEVVQQTLGRYAAALSEGERLLDGIAVYQNRTRGDIQEYRYEDMLFRIARTDAIQKYRAQFDLAARYAYLAATAYDYETNLIGSNAGSGESFLTDIVRHRTLGELQNGQPRAGSRGLADPLARMKLNFDVLKGQMGFNNPQTETNRFSLRHELLRKRDGSDGSDEAWRGELKKYLVDDLWDLPEFRRYARPFAPEEAGKQPALVIGYTGKQGLPLSTTVTSGLNYFGKELGGADSTYDPTNFVTKIRSVGVWFSNYNASGLSNTPRVYLIPVGADVLRAPSANDFGTREWQVVDQALPVPFPIGPTSLSNPDYLPGSGLSDSFAAIRRFSRFRAYHDGGSFSPAETTSDSRLIGRSVWNTRWLLIIPAETLLAIDPSHPNAGLDTFINSVDDIQLFFQTYAFSGN